MLLVFLSISTLVLFVILSNDLMSNQIREENSILQKELEKRDFNEAIKLRGAHALDIKALKANLTLSKLCEEDKARTKNVLEFDSASANIDSIATILAQTVSYPIQTACKSMKRIGK